LRKSLIFILASFGMLSAAGSAMAQQAAPDCPATPVVPPEWSAWATPAAVAAVAEEKNLSSADIGVGTASKVALLPTPSVHYIVAPEKPGGTVSKGGLVRFSIEKAGTYRVALGSGAWIDVLEGGQPLESVAHGHGPDCSGIRKMVDFPLKAGVHILQIAANGTPDVTVMVTPVP